MQRLRDAAEKAKCELSTVKETADHLPFLYTPKGGGQALHLQRSLTRDKLEELTADLVERCIRHCEQTLGEAKVEAHRAQGGAAGRRHDPHAPRAGRGAALLWHGAVEGRAPRRGGGAGRGGAGRGADPGRERRVAPRRDAAVAGRGRRGRLHPRADPQEHHRAHLGDRGVRHQQGRPDGGEDHRPPGRGRTRAARTRCWASSSSPGCGRRLAAR